MVLAAVGLLVDAEAALFEAIKAALFEGGTAVAIFLGSGSAGSSNSGKPSSSSTSAAVAAVIPFPFKDVGVALAMGFNELSVVEDDDFAVDGADEAPDLTVLEAGVVVAIPDFPGADLAVVPQPGLTVDESESDAPVFAARAAATACCWYA